MKKNFFKKLSFVLALAMIVSIVAPAAGAFAAADPTINVAKKYLFLGEKNEYDFHIDNKVKGSTYKWESSNEGVAVVDAKSGLTSAVAVGTATITCTISTKKDTWTSETTVIVKDNIKTLAITGDPTDKKLLVGATNDYNRTFTTQGGSTTKSTSITRWAVTDKDGKAVADTDASIDKTGLFKASKPGEYKIVAVAFQSTDKYNSYVTSGDTKLVLAYATTDVTVANDIKSVTQIDATTAKITFVAPTDSVSKADLTVSSLVNATSTKIKQSVKDFVLSSDKTYATVTMYAPLAAGTTYAFDYKNYKTQSLVAASANVADVTDMAITTTTATVGTATAVAVKLFNKDGVDISSIDASLLNRVTFTSSSEKVYYNAGKLTFFTVGDSTNVTAVFHTYSYDSSTGTEKGTITKTGTVAGVAAASYATSGVKAYTITNGTPNFSAPNTVIAAEDNGYKFYAQTTKTDGTNTSYPDSNSNSGCFRFKSSDASVLIVASNGTLYPVKAGTVNVVVEYSEDNGKTWTVLGAPEVIVKDKRVATSLQLSSYVVSLSNTAKFTDSADVTLKVYDQYNTEMTLSNPSLKANSTGIAGTVYPAADGAIANAKVTFSGTGATATTYTYAITANGLTKYVVVTVNAPTAGATDAASYKLSVGSSYDLKLSSTTTDVVANIDVVGYASNGVAFSKVSAASASSIGVVKLYKPDGSVSDLTANGTTTTYSYDLTPVTSGAINKVATGTYTLRLYGIDNKLLDTASFTVTDTQVAPTVTVNKTVTSVKTTLLAAVQDCVKVVNAAGTDVTTQITLGDVIGDTNIAAGSSVFVKTVKVSETYNGSTYTYTLNVNTLFTIN